MNPTGEGNWSWNWVTQLDTHTDTDTRYALYFYHISSSFFLNSIFLFNHRTPLSFLFCTCLSPSLRSYLSLPLSTHQTHAQPKSTLSDSICIQHLYTIHTTPSSPLSKSKQFSIPNPTYPTIGWMGLTSPWTSFACFCAYPNNIIVQGNRMVEISHSLCLVPLSLSHRLLPPLASPNLSFPFRLCRWVGFRSSPSSHYPFQLPFNQQSPDSPPQSSMQIRNLRSLPQTISFIAVLGHHRLSPSIFSPFLNRLCQRHSQSLFFITPSILAFSPFSSL